MSITDLATDLSVDSIDIDPAITSKRFACDLGRCRGACCTMPGEYGAPLQDVEKAEIERAYPVIEKYLSEQHRSVVKEVGLVSGLPGNYTTPVVHRRACVFVTYEDGIAKCSFEKAYWNNEITWRKPLSCHFFPIRVDRGVRDRLRFETLPECSPALERGESETIPLASFLKPALTRLYGEEWYSKFLDLCRDDLYGPPEQ